MLNNYACQYFKANLMTNINLKCKAWIIMPMGDESAVQISCSKKMFKKAVDRNLIKRRILNCFLQDKTLLTQRIKANSKYNLYKIYPNRAILNLSFDNLKKEIQKMFFN